MWQASDDFWISLPEDQKEDSLLITLGLKPLRITATFNDSNEELVNREGFIDVKIVTFERKLNRILVSVVENTTGLRFKKRILTLTISEHSDSETCHIEKINEILF